MNDCEKIREDSGNPNQSTEGEEGVAQVQSLPHGQSNLKIYTFGGGEYERWGLRGDLFLLGVSL